MDANEIAAPADAPADYESARSELAEIVRQLESGQAPLAQTMALWERGEALAAWCQARLDEARARVEAAQTTE